tara:strand:+ start:2803 stop:3849 length:1047 start_codon:yes stop_codon:yes gene_type:complete
MASLKQYAYYVKGNKLSIVEKDFTPVQNGQTLTAPDIDLPSGGGVWKSPLTTVADGLEIEYVYNPVLNYANHPTERWGIDTHGINGWTVIDGYLTLLRSNADWLNDYRDFSGHAYISVGENISVKNSNKWNGIHKIRHLGSFTNGFLGLQTHTRVNQSVKLKVEAQMTHGGVGYESAFNFLNDDTVSMFEVGSYVFVGNINMNYEENSGFFKVPPETSGPSEKHWVFNSEYPKYEFTNIYDKTETEVTPAFNPAGNIATNVWIYEAFRDPGAYISSDAGHITEDIELDLPSYLGNAVVYYMKAKLAEDAMNLELREYFMKEFRKQVEKHDSAKVYGSRQIISGPNAIR